MLHWFYQHQFGPLGSANFADPLNISTVLCVVVVTGAQFVLSDTLGNPGKVMAPFSASLGIEMDSHT